MSAAAIRGIMGQACRRAGLKRVGAHRLRHTLATEMLRGGASLPEIGQVLRHRSTLATSIYAKVDDNALRVLARPWPDRDTAVRDRERTAAFSRRCSWRSSTVRWCTSCSTLVQAAAASCWVVRSSTAAAVPPSLSARRDSEPASRRSAVIAFAGGSGLSMSLAVIPFDFAGTTTDSRQTATTSVPQQDRSTVTSARCSSN